MNTDILQGDRVRLAVPDFEKDFALFERWQRHTEYARLLDFGPIMVWSAEEMRAWHEKQTGPKYFFLIRRLSDDAPIGFIDLDGVDQLNHSAWVGIAIGEPECWSQGYGADAMRVLMRYAFMELNLHRVNLDVFADNPRAIKSYENAGFVQEGTARAMLCRDGRRWDVVYMGILRSDWDRLHGSPG
jgi:RimJ/RimL family protein N-acetyltransferase